MKLHCSTICVRMCVWMNMFAHFYVKVVELESRDEPQTLPSPSSSTRLPLSSSFTCMHMWQTIVLNSNSFIRFPFIHPSDADKPRSCILTLMYVLTLIYLLTFIFVFLPIASFLHHVPSAASPGIESLEQHSHWIAVNIVWTFSTTPKVAGGNGLTSKRSSHRCRSRAYMH